MWVCTYCMCVEVLSKCVFCVLHSVLLRAASSNFASSSAWSCLESSLFKTTCLRFSYRMFCFLFFVFLQFFHMVPLLWLCPSLLVCRKLKKMYRTIQEEKGKKRAAEGEDDEAEERPKQQFDKDFTLEPFEGVSPEYMEMSESLSLHFILSITHCCNHTMSFPCACLHIYSNPVWVRVSVCGLLPAGTGICSAQQRHRDPTRCCKICHWDPSARCSQM